MARCTKTWVCYYIWWSTRSRYWKSMRWLNSSAKCTNSQNTFISSTLTSTFQLSKKTNSSTTSTSRLPSWKVSLSSGRTLISSWLLARERLILGEVLIKHFSVVHIMLQNGSHRLNTTNCTTFLLKQSTTAQLVRLFLSSEVCIEYRGDILCWSGKLLGSTTRISLCRNTNITKTLMIVTS